MKNIFPLLLIFLIGCETPNKTPFVKPEIKLQQRNEHIELDYSGNAYTPQNYQTFQYKCDPSNYYGRTTIHVFFPENMPKEKFKVLRAHLKKVGYRNNQIKIVDYLKAKGDKVPVVIKYFQVFPPICDSTLYSNEHSATQCAFLWNRVHMMDDVSILFVDQHMGGIYSGSMIDAINKAKLSEKAPTTGGGANDINLNDILGKTLNPLGATNLGAASAANKNS